MPPAGKSIVRVFVSSTWRDLQPERKAVEAALHHFDETRFVGMELFGSREATPRDVSLAMVDPCELYVGIIGGRYGSGITEAEYHRAGERKIDRLVYVMQDPPSPEDERERFLGRIDGTYTTFTTPEDLAWRVTADVHRWLVEHVYNPLIRDAGFADDFRDAYISPDSVYARVQLERFSGREWLREEIDAFLTTCDRGYFVLEADAGLGKTAFVADLVRTRGWVHHFVELARGQQNVPHGLRNLAAQLVLRWNPQLAGAPSDVSRPDYLERLLTATAASRDRTAPDEKIVIVIDGLDESGPLPGQNVMGLPRALPPGVYFIVTLRPVPVVLDMDMPRWPPIRIQSSSPANIGDMRAFLERVADGESLAPLLALSGGKRDDFVSVLLERSGGVWIYLHYVLDELERGNREPLDLAALPAGLWSYYARYWSRRRNRPDWDAIEKPILAALAAAQEDVPVSLLCAFAGIAEASSVHRLLDEWRPFLATSRTGGETRYRCYHASLREFLEGRADRAALSQSEGALADDLGRATREMHGRIADRILAGWGGFDTALEGLRDPPRRDLDGGYSLRHLVTHLLSAKRFDELSLLLRATRGADENAWYGVHEQIRDLDGYLTSVHAVWAAATAASKESLSRGAPAPTVRLEATCALLLSSIGTLAELVRPRLLAALVEKRVWEPKHGLRYATQIGDAGQRMVAMARLVPFLQEPLRQKAFHAAVSAAGWSDAAAFAALPDDVAPEMLDAMLDRVLARGADGEKALVALVPKLAPHQGARVVEAVRAMPAADRPYEVLVALVPCVDPSQREQLLAWFKAVDRPRTPRERIVWELQLVPFLRPEQREQVILVAQTFARTKASDSDAPTLLGLTLPHLVAEEQMRVAREAIELTMRVRSWRRLPVLSQLIPRMPDSLMALAERKFAGDEFEAFVSRWATQPSKMAEALNRVEQSWTARRDELLAITIPHLPRHLIERAFRIAVEAQVAMPRSFDALAPHLSAPQLEAAIATLLAVGVRSEIPPRRLSVLEAVQQRTTADSTELPPHYDLLVALASHADPAELLAETLRRARRLATTDRLQLLIAIAVIVDAPARQKLLAEVVATLISGPWRHWIASPLRDLVIAIIPDLSEPLLRDVLAWAAAQRNEAILRVVLARLPEAFAAESVIAGRVDVDSEVDGVGRMAQPLRERLSRWISKRRGRNPEDVIETLAKFLPRSIRTRWLMHITATNGGWMLRQTLEAIRGAYPPQKQVTAVLRLLGCIPRSSVAPPVAMAFLTAFAIADPAARDHALMSLAPYLHPLIQRSLRHRTPAGASPLELLADTSNAVPFLEELRRTPAGHREPLLAEARRCIASMDLPALSTWAMLQLVPVLPEEEAVNVIRQSLEWSAISVLIDRWACWSSPIAAPIVEAAVAHLPILERYELLIRIAPHLPDALVANIWERAWKLNAGVEHNLLFRALVRRSLPLPPEPLHAIWVASLEHVAESRTSFELRELLPIADHLAASADR